MSNEHLQMCPIERERDCDNVECPYNHAFPHRTKMKKKTIKVLNRNSFNGFVVEGKAIGFTDDQIDFLWDWISAGLIDPEIFTHKDNYSLPSPKKRKK